MLKRFIPFAHAESIYLIDLHFFQKLGIKYVFVDLDNTLDSYKQKTPLPHAFELKENLKNIGIELIIVSNNTGERVRKYSKELGVKHWSSLAKPFSFRLTKIMKKLGIKKDEVIMVGDQIVTDISCANGAKIKSILTEKLVPEDQPTTRFNRLFDNPIRRKLKKKNLLRDWRQI